MASAVPRQRRAVPLHAHLVRAAMLALLPVAVLSVTLAVLLSREQQRSVEHGLTETARALAIAVDRELRASVATLQALATIDALDTADQRRHYHDLLERVRARKPGWLTVFVAEPDGRQLVNTAAPFGRSLPSLAELDLARQAWTSRAHVSNLIRDPTTGQATVTVTVPVIRESSLRYVLGATLALPYLGAIFSEQELPADWTGAILDGRMTIIARSRAAERFIGQPATTELATRAAAVTEGSFWDVTQEGDRAFGVFSRIPLAGWTVVLGIPASVVQGAVRRAVGVTLGGAALVIALGVGLALVLGRRLAAPITQLARSAEAVGQGRVPDVPPAGAVAEVVRVSDALHQAARLLETQADERARSDAALRESEERFRLVFEQGPLGMAIVGEDLKFVRVNARLCEILGYGDEELTRLTVPQVTHPDDVDADVGQAERLFRGEIPYYQLENRCLRKDGEVIWGHLTSSVIRDPAGRVRYALRLLQDITDRHRAERRSTAEHAVTRILAEARTFRAVAPRVLEEIGTALGWHTGAVWSVEPETGVLRCIETWAAAPLASPEFERLTRETGFRPGIGLPGRVWAENAPAWIPDVVDDGNFPRAAAARAAGIHAAFGFPIRIGAQVVGVVEFFSPEIRQPDGELLAMVEAVGRQLGQFIERERAEQALRAREAALREQTEALETVHRVGRMLTAELDIERLVQGVTDAATQLTGAAFGAFFYNVIDARGESYMLYTLSGAPREAFAGFPMPRNTPLFGPTFRGEQPTRIDDVTADRRYGQVAPHFGMPRGHLPVRSYLAVPVVSRSGEVLGGLFFGHPDTGVFGERAERIAVGLAAQAAVAMDNARLYERAQRARADAEAANRSKDEFLATLSHELRTPLNAVLGWAVMLRSGQLDEASTARALEAIERNARAQRQLIEDLLDISRIVTGKLRLDVRPVDLVAVIDAALDAVRPAADAKGVALSSVLDPSAGPVVGDADRLQQVVWNLLSNAIKFTPRGGHVRATLQRTHSHADIVVDDTGDGIPAAVLPYIFDRFRQASTGMSREHGGLGIGLALVKHLVELHGGSVRAESSGAGQGARFVVDLPLTRQTQSSASARTLGPPARSEDAMPGVSLADVRVLLVEDQPETLALFTSLLERHGATVQSAGGAVEALAILDGWRPDVLISDIEMPGEDGYQLMARIRARHADAGGDVPAIAVTAHSSADDRIRALGAGFQMHLPKPVEPAELVTVVATLVGRLRRT